MVKDGRNDNDDDIGDAVANEDDIVMDDNHFTDECDEDNQQENDKVRESYADDF